MKRNIFEGESYKAQFAVIAYRKLMTRKWITHADVMAEYMGYKSANDLPYDISKCEHGGELRKMFPELCCELKKVAGNGCIEERGNKRNKGFLYVGKDNDPLAGMYNAVFKKDIGDYYRFCQDSSGFFPTSWLDYFFDKTLDLFEIRKKKRLGHEIIGSEMTRRYKNIEWLPFVYECIRDHKVLQVNYHEKYQVASSVIFHPHYLKEFNGRWHIFGIIETEDTDTGIKSISEGQNIPLDRIDKKPIVLNDVIYLAPDKIKYPDLFSDIVGVTHIEGMDFYNIVIRIHDRYMFGLMETKPIHYSQRTTKEFDEHLGYGEVTMGLRPNHEFFGRVLQMGHDLEIISPLKLRDEIKSRINLMSLRYK